jgi:hypothetical protein
MAKVSPFTWMMSVLLNQFTLISVALVVMQIPIRMICLMKRNSPRFNAQTAMIILLDSTGGACTAKPSDMENIWLLIVHRVMANMISCHQQTRTLEPM